MGGDGFLHQALAVPGLDHGDAGGEFGAEPWVSE